MEKKVTFSVFTLVMLCCMGFVQAQETNASSSQKVLQNFLSLIENSSTYKNFKVVDRKQIAGFQSGLENFIQQQQVTKENASFLFDEKENAIASLQKEVTSLKNTNLILEENVSSVSFLGMSMGKGVFSVMVSVLILGFVATAGILYLKLKRANELTMAAQSMMRNMEEEFESFRRSSIERELSLKRKLFDEMKKGNGLRNAS